jgi:CubicO group peptidase (beta-lactamase class C family)
VSWHRAAAVAALLVFGSCSADGSSTIAATTPLPTTAGTTTPPPTMPSPTTTVGDVPVTDDRGVTLSAAIAEVIAGRSPTDVPGLAVVVVRDGAVVLAEGYGTTPDGDPITADTLFQVGSTSKLVAAVTAASMAQEGVLPWDTDIAPLLTGWALPPGAQSAERPVTVAAITSHTAGFGVDGFLGYGADQPLPTRPELLSGLGNSGAVMVETPPGTEYRYSGGGYEVLAQLIEDVSGRRYAEVVTERVFAPAGMSASGYWHPLDPERAARATGGAFDGEALPSQWQLHPEHAAAGLWTTADDMGALLVALTAALRDDGDELLDHEWARRLATPVVADPDGGWVGHGTFITQNERWFSHGGRNIGYCSSNAISVDGRFAAAVITNGFPDGSALGVDLLDAMAAAESWPDWG